MSEPESIDVTALDGPFTPERTAAAARLVAEAIRYLNHATAEASGTGHAADVWEVLGSLGVAVGRMRQTLDHMGRSLERDLAAGRLLSSEGGPQAEDARAGVDAARWQLNLAPDTAREVELCLADAQRLISGMSVEAEE